MKKLIIVSLIAIITLGLGLPSISNAESVKVPEEKNNFCNIDDIIAKDSTKKASEDKNGVETIEITDPETLKAIGSNLEKPSPDVELRSFTIVRDSNSHIDEKGINSTSEIAPQAIVSLKAAGTTVGCGSSRIGYVSGKGKINLSISESVKTTISGNLNVNLKKVNADLGKTIANSRTVKGSTSYTAPSGKTGVIEAYSSLYGHKFDGYILGVKAGSGIAWTADGVCFSKWY